MTSSSRLMPAILFALTGALLASAVRAEAQDQTYAKPRFGDSRLDWCLTWGANCGKPAADTFCKRRRFSGARAFQAEVVGTTAQTRLIGTNQTCSGSFCTAFSYITCEQPVPAHRVFANPVWNGLRLDVCQQWGTNCGKPAADAFCRSNGFSDSFFFQADQEPGYSSTRVIGTGQVCKGSFCTGFQQIICK